MVPCWATKAERRPGFTELHAILVDLGAMDSGTDTRNTLPDEAGMAVAPALSQDEARLLLGPSIHHLRTTLWPQLQIAMEMNAMAVPEQATIKDMVKAVVKPAGANRPCPRDGELGCAYVDLLDGSDHVGPSTALLSCKCVDSYWRTLYIRH